MHNGHSQVFKILESAKFHSESQVHKSYVLLSLGRGYTMLGFQRATWLPHSSKQNSSNHPLTILSTEKQKTPQAESERPIL